MLKLVTVLAAVAAAAAVVSASARADDGAPMPGDSTMKHQVAEVSPPVNGPVVLLPAEIGPTVIPPNGESQ